MTYKKTVHLFSRHLQYQLLCATSHRTPYKVHERISPKCYATALEHFSIVMSRVIVPHPEYIAQVLHDVIRS